MAGRVRQLSSADVEAFIEQGFVRLDEAFPSALADQARDILWRDTGCDPDDPSTWTRPVVRLGLYSQPPFVAAANTDALKRAFDQLVGPGRWLPRGNVGTFPVRFPSSEDPGDTGWHVDASFGTENPDFLSWRVNVHSKGRALLMLFLFSDVGPDDAPTRIRVGSHLDIARMLAPAGEEGRSLGELALNRFDETAHRRGGQRDRRSGHRLPVPSVSGTRGSTASGGYGRDSWRSHRCCQRPAVCCCFERTVSTAPWRRQSRQCLTRRDRLGATSTVPAMIPTYYRTVSFEHGIEPHLVVRSGAGCRRDHLVDAAVPLRGVRRPIFGGNRMTMIAWFLAELESEAAKSRRVLEQVPTGKRDWKPHEKSMELGYLSDLIANIPSWVGMAITLDELDIAPHRRTAIQANSAEHERGARCGARQGRSPGA